MIYALNCQLGGGEFCLIYATEKAPEKAALGRLFDDLKVFSPREQALVTTAHTHSAQEETPKMKDLSDHCQIKLTLLRNDILMATRTRLFSRFLYPSPRVLACLVDLCGLNNQFTCVFVCHISISIHRARVDRGSVSSIHIHPFGVISSSSSSARRTLETFFRGDFRNVD